MLGRSSFFAVIAASACLAIGCSSSPTESSAANVHVSSNVSDLSHGSGDDHARLPLPDFFVGYNEAWFGDNYATDLTTNFDIAFVNRQFNGIARAGGRVVRLWIFEGAQGIVFDPSSPAPQTRGISPTFLHNLDQVVSAARAHGLWVYITALNSSEAVLDPPPYQSYFYNMFNNVNGELDAYENLALGPTLDLLNSHDNVWGFDLVNEIEAAVVGGVFPDFPNSPRAFIKHMRDFVRTKSPNLKVTASSGFGDPAPRVAAGLYTGLGLDFYDIHEYSDAGSFDPTGLCERAQADGVFVILGEYGQSSQFTSDAIQTNETANFLALSKQLPCMKGALAWRYPYSALSTSNWFNYVRADGSFRPAVDVIRQYSDRHGDD